MATRTTAGVDVGGTKMLAVALDEAGAVIAVERRSTPSGTAALVEGMASIVEALAGRCGSLGAVGAGIPGMVDRDGAVRFSPNLPGVVDAPIRALLADRLGQPVVVENDATCAAWAERSVGAGQGSDDVIVVTLGTGIGGGIVSGRHLLLGRNGFAGEIGHMVVDTHGPPCPCGQRGCWERYASGSGLGRLARDAAQAGRADRVVELAGGDPESVRGEHVTSAAAEGDPGALEIIDTFAWWLALGLANLANAFDPEVFVLGGGLAASGDVLLEPARRAFIGLVEGGSTYRPAVRIVQAALGERAGAIGAALLAGGS